MYNLLISLLAGGLTFVTIKQATSFSALQAVFPSIFVLIGAYFYLSRRTWKKVEQQIKDAMAVLEPFSQRPDLAQQTDKRNAIVDEAVRKLKLAYGNARWQFLVRAQVDAQIGIILFSIKQDVNGALSYLERSFKRNWVSQAMLAVCYMKKHKPEKMTDTFELAVRMNKKQDLLWNLYAYCLQKIKQKDKALEVMSRACKTLPSNQPLAENLVALQNNKKMKMKSYGEQWYQFHLEKPPTQKTRNPRFSRR